MSAEHRRFQLIDAAFREGNLAGLKEAYTPLHMAVSERYGEATKLLLDAGADRSLRTRIDECETPLEMAERAGLHDLAALLRREEKGSKT